jgi:hypothetical protein
LSTFLGGTGVDNGNGIALDTADNIYITGRTSSGDFPITPGAFQTVNAGTTAFVAKISPIVVPSPVVTGISPTTGSTAGGTVVTITGSGFTGATTVEFGTVAAASFTVNSDGSITATTPAEPAATVDVTVTTPAGGTSSTSAADQFTFFSPPPPPPPAPPSTVIAGPPNDAFEPNDTSETATQFGVLVGAESFAPLSINIHTVNGHPVFDQDWYTWTAGITGTFTSTLSNIQANGGDINERLFVQLPNGSLELLNSSTLLGGVPTQTASINVQAGQHIYVWVYGYDFALGTYDLSVNLS